MSTAVKIILGIFGVIVIFGVIAVSSVVGTRNDAVRQEAGIKAQYSQNQNNYSNYIAKLAETAQVPSMYMEDLTKLYSKVVEGRKGSDQELFRFIKEANPTVDASIYKQIQQVIEAGRNSFEADQKTLLDKRRVYEVALQSFPGNMVLGAFGFPRLNLAEYDIVTDDKTAEAFKTKRAAPIKLREAAPAPAGS